MTSDFPNLLIANEPPKTELYAMECTLEASRRETLGNGEVVSTCKWSGFASLEVVDKMLDMMRAVVER